MPQTVRQQEILEAIIEEHIKRASPVSSQVLGEARDFGLSSATLRSEMANLTEQGFLAQPHTAAGRVPTDKGYRFYVDSILEEQKGKRSFERLLQEMEDEIQILQSLTRLLRASASGLTIAYLSDREFFWKEGWEEVLEEPEFEEHETVESFLRFLQDLENAFAQEHLSAGELQVYIGKENPFSPVEDFSIIVSGLRLPKRQTGVLALAGPKRMAYPENIGALRQLLWYFQ
ncbi:MAG: hypothetical protein Q8P39_00195 [Candidatus Yanofskybacteria bacterium]|nr:hypothetical protein [Candidatus Yanofskybacteria bacterium]